MSTSGEDTEETTDRSSEEELDPAPAASKAEVQAQSTPRKRKRPVDEDEMEVAVTNPTKKRKGEGKGKKAGDPGTGRKSGNAGTSGEAVGGKKRRGKSSNKEELMVSYLNVELLHAVNCINDFSNGCLNVVKINEQSDAFITFEIHAKAVPLVVKNIKRCFCELGGNNIYTVFLKSDCVSTAVKFLPCFYPLGRSPKR